MFISLTLLVMLVFAVLVSADRSLLVKITGPGEVDGVDKLTVTASLTNTGNETLTILNDPGGILSKIPTIGNDNGTSPQFTGVRVKYEFDFVVASLQPGQSIDVKHDLSAAYNFTLSGHGAYHFDAHNLFHIVDDPNTTTVLTAETKKHKTALFGRLVVPRSTPFIHAQSARLSTAVVHNRTLSCLTLPQLPKPMLLNPFP